MTEENIRQTQDFTRRKIESVFNLPKDCTKGTKPIYSFSDHDKGCKNFAKLVNQYLRELWL